MKKLNDLEQQFFDLCRTEHLVMVEDRLAKLGKKFVPAVTLKLTKAGLLSKRCLTTDLEEIFKEARKNTTLKAPALPTPVEPTPTHGVYSIKGLAPEGARFWYKCTTGEGDYYYIKGTPPADAILMVADFEPAWEDEPTEEILTAPVVEAPAEKKSTTIETPVAEAPVVKKSATIETLLGTNNNVQLVVTLNYQELMMLLNGTNDTEAFFN